jgi:hypothetical protein
MNYDKEDSILTYALITCAISIFILVVTFCVCEIYKTFHNQGASVHKVELAIPVSKKK